MRNQYDLTAEELEELMEMKGSVDTRHVADQFGVHMMTVRSIWNGVTRPEAYKAWQLRHPELAVKFRSADGKRAFNSPVMKRASLSDTYVSYISKTLNLGDCARGVTWASTVVLTKDQKEALAVIPDLLGELLELRRELGKSVVAVGLSIGSKKESMGGLSL